MFCSSEEVEWRWSAAEATGLFPVQPSFKKCILCYYQLPISNFYQYKAIFLMQRRDIEASHPKDNFLEVSL